MMGLIRIDFDILKRLEMLKMRRNIFIIIIIGGGGIFESLRMLYSWNFLEIFVCDSGMIKTNVVSKQYKTKKRTQNYKTWISKCVKICFKDYFCRGLLYLLLH